MKHSIKHYRYTCQKVMKYCHKSNKRHKSNKSHKYKNTS